MLTVCHRMQVMYLEAVELMEEDSKQLMLQPKHIMVNPNPYHQLWSSSFNMSIMSHRMRVQCICRQWS